MERSTDRILTTHTGSLPRPTAQIAPDSLWNLSEILLMYGWISAFQRESLALSRQQGSGDAVGDAE